MFQRDTSYTRATPIHVSYYCPVFKPLVTSLNSFTSSVRNRLYNRLVHKYCANSEEQSTTPPPLPTKKTSAKRSISIVDITDDEMGIKMTKSVPANQAKIKPRKKLHVINHRFLFVCFDLCMCFVHCAFLYVFCTYRSWLNSRTQHKSFTFYHSTFIIEWKILCLFNSFK